MIRSNPPSNETCLISKYGLLATSALALYFTWSAIKEKRAKREESSD